MLRLAFPACALGIAILLASTAATAGSFTYLKVDPSDDLWVNGTENILGPDITWAGTKHSYTFNTTSAVLGFQEGTVSSTGVDPYVTVSGDTDGDPIFHMDEAIQNTSGVSWTGWKITLSGSATFDVASAPSSDTFHAPYTLTSGNQVLTFGSPDNVLNGSTVNLHFDISVPTTGLFSFGLTQEAIPEPATLSLLALGGLALLRRK
jgi:hypothetical protein